MCLQEFISIFCLNSSIFSQRVSWVCIESIFDKEDPTKNGNKTSAYNGDWELPSKTFSLDPLIHTPVRNTENLKNGNGKVDCYYLPMNSIRSARISGRIETEHDENVTGWTSQTR